MRRRAILVGPLAVCAVGWATACTGGPGSFDGLDFPFDKAPSSYDNPGAGREAPPPGQDMPAVSNQTPPGSADNPGSQGSACPPCGNYACVVTETVTSNGSTTTKTDTVTLPLTPLAGGGCALVANQQNVVLSCGGSGSVTDGTSSTAVTWSASGSNVTITGGGASISCTVGGSTPAPAPTTTAAPPGSTTASPPPTPVPGPPPSDAGAAG